MEKNQIKILVATAILFGILICVIGFIAAMTWLFYAGAVLFTLILLDVIRQSVNELKGGK